MSLTLTALIGSITVFVLAIFLGFELISKVPPTLHTPLMSGANAISGITIVGALILSNATFNGMETSFAKNIGIPSAYHGHDKRRRRIHGNK